MTDIAVISDYPAWNVAPGQLEKLVRQLQKRVDLSASELNIIFVTDDYLSQLHSDYLNNDSLTDIMTFNLGERDVEGEIYISVDRARAHAEQFGVPLVNELTRLIIHGLLHLKGYDDQTEAQHQKIRELEDYHLQNSLPLNWNRAFEGIQ